MDTRRMNAKEAAALIGRSEKTVRKWIRDGALPATRSGYRWSITRAALAQVAQVELAEVPAEVPDAPSQAIAALHDRLDRLEVQLDRLAALVDGMAAQLEKVLTWEDTGEQTVGLNDFAHAHGIERESLIAALTQTNDLSVPHDSVTARLRQRGVSYQCCQLCLASSVVDA